jgi:hypothetical protein
VLAEVDHLSDLIGLRPLQAQTTLELSRLDTRHGVQSCVPAGRASGACVGYLVSEASCKHTSLPAQCMSWLQETSDCNPAHASLHCCPLTMYLLHRSCFQAGAWGPKVPPASWVHRSSMCRAAAGSCNQLQQELDHQLPRWVCQHGQVVASLTTGMDLFGQYLPASLQACTASD